MLRVLFFARLKEELGCPLLELDWDAAPRDLDALFEHLCELHGPAWREALGQDNIIRAVNQEVVADNRALCDGDEVAFFPPVTGG